MQNVGTLDRIVRVVLGLILIALPFAINPGAWASWALFVIGAVLIATAAFSFCPLYAALGLTSRRKNAL